MAEWEMQHVGDVAQLTMGQSPKGSLVKELESGLPFLQGNAEFGSRFPTARFECDEAPRRSAPGDSLISVRAPVGDINRSDRGYGIGRGLAAVTFKSVDSDFGHYAIIKRSRYLDRVSQGTTFSAIGRAELAALQLPVPPLEEQRRIAEILDTLDETFQSTERVIAKRKRIRGGLAASLLSGRSRVCPPRDWKTNETPPPPVSISTSRSWGMAEWEMQHVGDVAQLTMGQSPKGSLVKELESGLPFLQGNAEFGSRFPTARFECDEAPRRSAPGDSLISVRAPVGDINRSDRGYGIGRGLAAVTFKSVDSDFGHYAIIERSRYLDRVSQGTTFSAIGRAELAALQLPVPPLEEQRRIAEILDTLDETIRANEQQRDKLRRLRSGLAADLLSGRVRTVAA